MWCQEAGFMTASCRIEVEPRHAPSGVPQYLAVMSVIERGTVLRPLVFADGSRAEIPGETPSGALNAAIAFLSDQFGAITEYSHNCMEPVTGAEAGDPLIIGA